MRKVEPTIKVLLICLVCLFAFSAQAQKIENPSSNPAVLEAKKNLASQKKITIPQKPEPFNPETQAATSAQMQQVQAIGNTALVKTSAQKTGLQGKANVVVNYNPTPVKMTREQMQQIRLNNGRDNRVQPPMVDMSELKMSTDTCDGTVVFDDPSICSVPPNPGGNIDIVVDAFECSFSSEEDNGDGTLTIYGLSVFVDPSGDSTYLGAVLESETFNTTACSTMPLMVPANIGCVPTFTDFAAVTGVFTVDSETGVISNFAIDTDCDVEYFTVTVNPNLTAEIISNDGDACGTLTAALIAEDGSECATATATCIGPGDTPSITFNYPYPDPMDGNTYQECPPTQTITGTPCTGCPCGGEVEYEDVTTCVTADNDNGDGTINVPIPEVSCMISPEVPNGDNIFTIYSFDVYNPAGVLMTSLYESATLGASACDGLSLDIPVNDSCNPISYTFTVETSINTLEILEDTTLIVSFGADPLCEVASFDVTVLPTLTADIVSDGGGECGTLTVGFYNAAGELCEGTEETAMCINFGDEPSVTLTDPYGCGSSDPITITGASCENCECGGIVDYEDEVECSADLNGDGSLTVPSTSLGCSINPETVYPDGSIVTYSFDLYAIDADGNGTLLTFFEESATFGTMGCIGDLSIIYPVNTTCEAITYNLAFITAINYYNPDGTFDSFVDDPSCTPEFFSTTINPTLTAQITDDTSAECGSFTAALFAEDGTQCGDAVTSATCETDGEDVSVTLDDPFGCADPSSLEISAPCDGCFPIMCSDNGGCQCFPNGIDLDGDGINDLAFVEFTITDDEVGKDWVLSASTGLLNPDGTPTTATVVDNGDGTYTLTAYVNADGSTYSATFSNTAGDEPCVVEGEACLACPPPLDEVPTVGEWGLIMLGLLMTIAAVVGIRQRREEEVYA